jgi:hypothetical protein
MWHENRLPPWLTLVCIGLTIVVFGLLMLLPRSGAVDRQIAVICGWGALTAVVREPAVATSPLLGWIPPYVLFDVWHWLFLMFCVAAVGLVILGMEDDPARVKTAYRRWYIVGVAIGPALLVLSHEARSQGLNVVEGGGWQYGAYFLLYCSVPVGFCLYVAMHLQKLRARAASWRERLALLMIVVFTVGGAINLSVLAAGAVMASTGVENAFTEETAVRASGELIVVFLAVAAISAVPSTTGKVAGSLRLDGASRLDRRLLPLWRDLTSVTPEVVLPLSLLEQLKQRSVERLYRRTTEIHDSVRLIERALTDDDVDLATAVSHERPSSTCADVWLTATCLAATCTRLAEAAANEKWNNSDAAGVLPAASLEDLADCWAAAKESVAGAIAEAPISR